MPDHENLYGSLFQLRELTEETLDLLRDPLSSKHIHVNNGIRDLNESLWADRDQIKQVLLNIFQNAIEAMPEKGTLTLQGTRDKRGGELGILLTIADTGKGIAASDLNRIFDPFYTSGKYRGTGLGLAICKNILEAHGGEIRAQSKVQSGTIMSVWLPIVHQPQLSMVT